MDWEFQILYFLQELHIPWLDSAMVFFSSLANHGEIWLVIGLAFLCFARTRKIGIAMLISITLSFIAGNLILKNLIVRPRPCWIDNSIELLILNPGDYSFPSGHTLVGFTSSVSIFLQQRKWGAAAFILASIIAFSRLYLFVHFPTDILGGIVLGTVVSFLVYRVMMIRGYLSEVKAVPK